VANENEIDGIRFDEHGNPVLYRLLDYHPGDHRQFLASRAGDWKKAEFILHYFSPLRPGQVRGVSELTPALSLFGELRQFTKAVLMAAARAAEIAGVMQTTLLPDGAAAELSDPLTTIEAVRNAIVSLPEGWTLSQLKAEQPTTTYDMFKREIINEIARCLSIPYNIAACDSSSYNYASGRLDHQTYDRSIEVERADVRAMVLDRIYAAWLEEYAAVAGLGKPQVAELSDHEWHFAGRGHVDPNKEASADETRLRNGTLTRARYWAKQGADWKRESAQWIKERIELEKEWNEAREAAGLEPAPYPGEGTPATQPERDEDEEDQNRRES
jgi:capsid protein